MKTKLLEILLLSIIIVNEAAELKSIINYLGSNYILSDGCPLPTCNVTSLECGKIVHDIRERYSRCIQSVDGQHVGCVTNRVGDGSFLTFPVYATLCSAICYEYPAVSDRVKKCPYPGHREHSPELNEVFN